MGENLTILLIWVSRASCKVMVFSYQLLQDMIPSRENMSKPVRGWGIVDSSGIYCPLCGDSDEPVSQFLVTCELVVSTWYIGSSSG